MKKTLNFLGIIAAMIYVNKGISQVQVPNQDINPYLHLTTPQTCDFVRYGNLPISHYTGQVTVPIPIYNYKDGDFELPLSISYNSFGFMPNKQEGVLGLDWTLNAGGVIMRVINGEPDDKMGKDKKLMTGWYQGIKEGKIPSTITKESIFTLQGSTYALNSAELRPDEFIINSPGLKGSFFIGPNGRVFCRGNTPFIVSLDGLKAQPNSGLTLNTHSSIVVTADNGYKYYFGGDINSLEISYQYEDPNCIEKDPNKPSSSITGWHLTKIVAPNGRAITYTYENCQTYEPPTGNSSFSYQTTKYYIHNISTTTTHVVRFGGAYTPNPDRLRIDEKDDIATEIIKPAYIKTIAIDNTKINFNYAKYGSRDTYLITDISIKYKNDIIEKAEMTYQSLGSPYSRLFLTEVKMQTSAPYKLAYYNTSDQPIPLTKGIDHWGFWNGKDNNTKLIPQESNTSIREPNFNYCMTGALKTIHYPTGGYSIFYYEPHYYSKLLERKPGFNQHLLPALSNKPGMAGGIRVQKIEDFDENGVRNTKEYKYVKGYSRYNQELPPSGILMEYPRYSVRWAYRIQDSDLDLSTNPPTFVQVDFYTDGVTVSNQSFHTNHYPKENYIHYSEVVEILGNNNGYKIYKFSNYETCPDAIDFKITSVASMIQFQYVWAITAYNSIPGIPSNSRHFERGLIKEILHYRGNGTLIESKKFDYTDMTDYPDEWGAGALRTGAAAATYKIYHYPVKPKQETVTQYLNGREYTTVTKYTYDTQRKNGYLIKQAVTNSDNVTEETQYHYVEDMIAGQRGNYNAFQWMKDKNIINVPIEKLQYKGGLLANASFLSYNTFPLSATRTVYPDKLLTIEAPFLVSNYNTTGIDSRLKPDTQYERYDELGNPLQIRKKDNIPVSFLWSYGKRYPVAEVKGAMYDEVVQKLGANEVKRIADSHLSDEELCTKLEKLKELLPQAMITIYTHSPLVGVSSKTDPNGHTTYYEYDSSGRLQTVKDHLGNVLQQYEYKYGGQ